MRREVKGDWLVLLLLENCFALLFLGASLSVCIHAHAFISALTDNITESAAKVLWHIAYRNIQYQLCLFGYGLVKNVELNPLLLKQQGEEMKYFKIKACFPSNFPLLLNNKQRQNKHHQPQKTHTKKTYTGEQKVLNGKDYFLKISLLCYLNMDSMIQLLRQWYFAVVIVTEGSTLLWYFTACFSFILPLYRVFGRACWKY